MSDVIQQAEAEIKKVEGEVKAEVIKVETVAREEFDALVARVESLEKGAVSEIKALEAKVKAVFQRIGHVF